MNINRSRIYVRSSFKERIDVGQEYLPHSIVHIINITCMLVKITHNFVMRIILNPTWVRFTCFCIDMA